MNDNMRQWMKIAESAVLSSEPALRLIACAEDKYGFNALSGGNCGQFALAMARYLRARGVPASLAMIMNQTDVEDFRDLQGAEIDLYHVVLEVCGHLYDATGAINHDYLFDFSVREYRDANPAFWSEIEPDEIARRVISHNTAWNIDWADFIVLFNSLDSTLKPTPASPIQK
ncbi:MAG: hypothetical protein ACLGIM_12245 [Alphaproteobacteria bacterium]